MNRLSKFYIYLILIVLAFPALGMLLYGPSSAGANETLSPKPTLLTDKGNVNINVLADTADYFADRFFYRQEMITAWSSITVKLFNTSPESQIILGKNGWLYYSATLDDYTGTSYSDQMLNAVVKNLSLIQEYLGSNGAEFIFTVAPNKNTLYPQYMPDNYTENHSKAPLSKLNQILSASGINYADLWQAFAPEDILYYSTDSHWNSKGAALAADCILTAADKKSQYYNAEFQKSLKHEGDLYKMLFPKGKKTEDDYLYTPGFDFICDRDPNNGEAINIITRSDNKSGHLYCWRDSFGVSLYPYLADCFGTSVFTRSTNYDMIKAVASDADCIVIEIVERNLLNLAKTAPKLPAPDRAVDDIVFELNYNSFDIEPYNDGLYSIDGTIKNTDQSISSVYILSDGVYYEACLVIDSNGNLGFSALLPTNNIEGVFSA